MEILSLFFTSLYCLVKNEYHVTNDVFLSSYRSHFKRVSAEKLFIVTSTIDFDGMGIKGIYRKYTANSAVTFCSCMTYFATSSFELANGIF